VSDRRDEELLAELARRVEARRRAGDYDLAWLDDRVQELDPVTPVDRFLQTPPGSLRAAVRAALTRSGDASFQHEADLRLREAVAWLKLALDAEGAAREEVHQALTELAADRVTRVEGLLRALGHSHGERIDRLEDDRRWSAAAWLRTRDPGLLEPGWEAGGLASAEARVYSQNGEDGIIAWLLSRVGITDRRFVEIGIGDGRECNTAALAIVFGWRGLMIDAWPAGVTAARAFYGGRPETRDSVTVVLEKVTRENVDALLTGHAYAGEFDLLSIDIDGNDLWIWEALSRPSPRVVVVEYNGTFGPDRSVSVPYDPGFDRLARHPSGWYHGASLRALERLARRKGYVLAGCDSNGVNAFFVRADCAEGAVVPVAPEHAWRPVRERPGTTAEQFAAIARLPLVDVP
jgi:hypothetical protein